MKNYEERKFLDEVSNWKLEAADEDSKRYFFHNNELESLESGKSSIVVGRKGTGKTAICRYFETNIQYNRFCLKLSFKEFPFNILYKLEDSNFTTPSQYISLWKYFIYNSILKMMAANQSINPEFQSKIQYLYPNDEFVHANALMEKWTQKNFGFGIFTINGQIGYERHKKAIEDVWHDLIPIMETMIIRNIDQSNYFIVFDELDEDYRNYWDIKAREKYISLITSLFKATSNVRRVFADSHCRIFPIIFLRDDIYELLSDPDKNKWEDHKINLSWKKDGLKKMIAFRLARSKNINANSFDFDKEWASLFLSKTISVGDSRKKKRVPSFDYILSLTHSRPRDFIRFLRDACRSSIEQGHHKINEDTIRGVDRDFSDHFREELVNEMAGIMPDINDFLGYIGLLRKQRFNYTNFLKYVEKYQKTEECSSETKDIDPISVIKILFHFSILGNASRRTSTPIYKYQRNHLAFNPSEPLVIHRGLVKTLGLN